MDPLTHTITGWLVARAVPNLQDDRAAPYATPTLLVAANIPELDLLHLLGGSAFYLAHHRTWTHSIPGAAILGAAVGLGFWKLAQRRGQPASAKKLAALGVLGAFMHILLDWMTADGAQLLWPIVRATYALDWFPTIDLWLLVALILGVALPGLFRLITEEIGARSTSGGMRAGARLALSVFLALALGRAVLHADATTQLEARLYNGRTPLRIGAFPMPLNPFRWVGVVETESTAEVVPLTLAGRAEGSEQTFYKPAPSPAAEAALATDQARIFLAWARFPHATVTPRVDHGWRVELRDLRAGTEMRSSLATLRIEIDPDGQVASTDINLRFLLLLC